MQLLSGQLVAFSAGDFAGAGKRRWEGKLSASTFLHTSSIPIPLPIFFVVCVSGTSQEGWSWLFFVMLAHCFVFQPRRA